MTNCDCSNNGIKAYFKLDYKPNKLSQLANDTHYVDINDVLNEINTHNTSETAHTYIQGRIDATNTTIGDLTELDTSVKTSVVDAINSEVSARGNADTALENDYNAKIGTLSNLDSSVKTDVVSAINSVISDEATIVGDLDDLDTSVKTSIVTAINSEVSDRQSADSGLQTQIDALAASSDVTDIVGTYAELQAYDTQHLNDNDIIKVLDDSTHNDAPSYYRYNKSTDSFTYIGSESASYTKAESDTLFVPQTRTVNSKALSADITLTSSDVGALASTTTINDLTTTAQQNALNSGATTTNIGQIATNTSSISTINEKIPSDASSSNKLVTASALSNAVVNLADKDLANLTQTGEERLHALKAYSDNGELLTDAEGLADVTNYAHSTFDLSKFTVVGSPNITDGIVSRFSSSNYVKISTLNISNPFTICSKLKTGNDLTGYQDIIDTYGTTSDGFIFRIQNGNFICTTTDGTTTASYTVNTNTEYFIKIVYNGSDNLSIFVSTNGVTYTQIINKTVTALSGNKTVYLGVRGTATPNNAFLGSIDLKQFSITVDNIPVFSGNKTGIDTIKADDYTVADGTPSITADGVFTSTTSNAHNYISLDNFTASVDLRAEFEFSVIGGDYSGYLINSGSSTNAGLYINDYGLTWALFGANNFKGRYYIASGHSYKLYLEWKADGTTELGIKRDDESAYSTSNGTWTGTLPTEFIIGYRYNNKGVAIFDLNKIKFYSGGNLIYQPCLKIPYTESKTGSKVVNYIYRDRVNDMAEQFGSAPYYTLSDTDFTLPQVELYGMIGHRTLKASYRNGISYWELWSDRTLEQGGTCTSGVEYTLLKPFTDTNYVLTIPYTSKTATTFIPSATGDFIAKGVGTL